MSCPSIRKPSAPSSSSSTHLAWASRRHVGHRSRVQAQDIEPIVASSCPTQWARVSRSQAGAAAEQQKGWVHGVRVIGLQVIVVPKVASWQAGACGRLPLQKAGVVHKRGFEHGEGLALGGGFDHVVKALVHQAPQALPFWLLLGSLDVPVDHALGDLVHAGGCGRGFGGSGFGGLWRAGCSLKGEGSLLELGSGPSLLACAHAASAQ